MQKVKVIVVVIAAIIVFAIVAYLTRLGKKTGVPFYRHNEVYEIIKSNDSIEDDDSSRNYTKPFRKYSLIDNEDELNQNYVDPLGIADSNVTN